MENVFSEKLLHPSGPNCLKDKNEPQQLGNTLHEIGPGTTRGTGIPGGTAQAAGAPSRIRSTPPTIRATPSAETHVRGSRKKAQPASAVSATPAADQIP